MILRTLDVGPFRRQAWFDRHVGVADGDDVVLAVGRELAPYERIGFDPASHALSVSSWQKLERLVPLPGLMWELRLVKSPAEIARIRMAAAILDEVFNDAIAAAAPGVRIRRLLSLVAARLLELGADPAHLGYVSVARGWNFLHAQPDDKPLQVGDVLHLELVARVRGYEARLMRCVAFGPVPAGVSGAAGKLKDLQERQIAAMKPGALARDVDAILREGVLKAGLREEYDNITGYTLGYYSRQPVRSSDFTRCFLPSADWRLEPGMVFHMYASAAGVSFSETVLVGEGGPERLSRLERQLFER